MSPQQREYGEEREFSGSEDDDVLDEDMEALRRACMITGTNPDDLDNRSPSFSSAAAGGSNSNEEENADADDGDDEDLELLQNIRNRFSIPSDEFEPLSMKPLCSLPPAMPDEEEDDDFETLRAVQKRFAAYDNDALKNFSEKQEQVYDICMSLQKTSNDLAVDTFDVCKGLLDSEFACQTTHLLDDRLEEQPSTLIDWHHKGSSKPSTSQPSYSSFPKSAKVFMDAIKRNRSFQKFLRSKLIQIEAKIEENKRLKERLKILKDFQINCKRRTGRALSQKKDFRVQLISVKRSSSSKDSKVHDKKISAMYYGPVENSHVTNYRMALTKLPLSLDRKKWSEVEKKNLEKGIRQQFQEMALQIMMDQLSGTGESFGDLNDLDNILLSIKDLVITQENIREFLPRVNWEQLASMYVMGRSGAECEARWLNFEDPLINCNPWTAQEDKNLLFLVQKKGIGNWFDIAVSLGTNRTPFQCLTRYQRSLNVSILKREWTKDEDAKLRSAVEAYGEGDWQHVASALEGWTGTQCSNRWKKSLHPTREKVGRWTADEDRRLKVAQMLFGPRNWKKTAQFVPGRTEVQCRERWVNSLDPLLSWDKWTEEEDCKLRAAIAEHGYCWSKVAAAVPRRTDNMCRRRWKRLLPHEVPLLQAARKMQKAALICNFVDRESERPALGPNDFRPLPVITSREKVNHDGKQTGNLRRGPKSGKKIIKSFCKVTKKRRFVKSTENAETGTEEGLAINGRAEVETIDGPEAAAVQSSENNNLTKPEKDHPSSPLISLENRRGLAGPDSKRKKGSPKAQSVQKEHNEPDEVRECLPVQLESLNSTSSDDGIEPVAENNTSLTKRRSVSKQICSRNVCTTGLEELQSVAVSSGKSLLTETTDDVIGKRKKRSRKAQSVQKEHTELDEVRGCLPLQPESLNLTGNGDGIGPVAENNTMTKTRRFSKRKCSRNICTTASEELQSTTLYSGKPLLTEATDVIANRKKRSCKAQYVQKERTELDEVRECLPLQPESLNLTGNGDGIGPVADNNTMTKTRRVSKRKCSRNICTTDSEELQSTTVSSGKPLLTEATDVIANRKKRSCKAQYVQKERTELDEVREGKSLLTEATDVIANRKKQSCKAQYVQERTELKEVRECLPLQPECLNLTGISGGIEPVAENNTTLTKTRRVSKLKCSRNVCTTKWKELKSTTVSSGKSLLAETTDDVKHQCDGSSCINSVQLLLTNGEDIVSLGGNTSIKQFLKRKKGAELAGVLEDVVSGSSQDNELEKVKPRGTSCLDQNLGTADDDIPLCFLSKKLKRRKLQFIDCQNNEVVPPSIILKKSELFPEGVDTLKGRNSIPSAMQDEELKCCDGETSVELSSCNMKSSLVVEGYTIVPTDNEPGKENLVGAQKVASKELMEKAVSVDAQSGHGGDDLSLAFFVQEKSKKERQTSKRGSRACQPSSLMRGSQLLSKRVNQLHNAEYKSSVPGVLDPVRGTEVAFDKREWEQAGNDNEVSDTPLSCLLQNKSKKRRLQSTKK